MELRIVISGPSGVGKSTLAEFISKTYNIPFVTTSTKPLWDKHGITSHEHLIQMTLMDKAWGLSFQNEVLNYRIEKLSEHKEYVTDRSPVDNLAYFLSQNSHMVSEKNVEDYIVRCLNALADNTGLIAIPYTSDIVLEDDGKRVNNKYYQRFMNGAFHTAGSLISDFSKKSNILLPPHVAIQKWDMLYRKEEVQKFINHILVKS